MRIENEIKLDYSDVLIRPKRSTMKSRREVDLFREFKFRNNSNVIYGGVPIMAANMDGVGTIEMANTLSGQGLFTCLAKPIPAKEIIDWAIHDDTNEEVFEHTALSIGTSEDDLEKLSAIQKGCDNRFMYICMDVANGYQEYFVERVKMIRERFHEMVIIAGNVVTGEMTEQLILAGADIVKVGIGPGAVCTTRLMTGVGFPQLSAVIECADAAHGLDGHVIADGGCVSSGDVAKAFAAGADFVMLGTMLAGTDQGGGEIIEEMYQTNRIIQDVEIVDGKGIVTTSPIIETKHFVKFYGMSSETANKKHFGGLKDYRASEGRTTLVPYRGDVLGVVQEILGGLRSACTYVGARKLKHLSKCTTFVRCNNTHNRSTENNTIGK